MCVRFLRRRDGTIVSGECAGGIARRKWTGRLLGVAGLALIAGAGFGAAAMGGEVVGKAPAEHDDVEEVAGGVSSYDDGEGRPYDLPEGSDYGEPNYGNVGNVGGAPIGGFNSGNRNR
jgi:hypothetical protein